mgnify:CR=1 FL=1
MFTDRGCLGSFDGGIKLNNGHVVSNIEAIKSIRPHPTRKTPYGISMLDYTTFPAALRRDPPPAKEDTEILQADGSKILVRKGEPLGEIGVDLSATISLVLGAIKELDARLERLERRSPGAKEV